MQLIKTVKIMLVFLLISSTLVFFTRKSTVFEVEKIAKDLTFIQKISDFNSNKNHPIEQVENIGINLYLILRNNSRKKPYKINVQQLVTEESEKRKMEYVTSFEINYFFPNKKRLTIYINHYFIEGIYRIKGYSGGF